MSDGSPSDAGSGQVTGGMHRLESGLRGCPELALVEDLAGECVDVRMKPMCLRKEEAASGIDDGAPIEHELQRRAIHSVRMGALLHLGELLWIAQEHHVPRRA